MKRAIKVKPAGTRKVPAKWHGKSGVYIRNVRSFGMFARPGGWLRKFRFDGGKAVVDHIAVSPYIAFRSGESVRVIARDYGVPVGVIEDIVRFYLLHPEAARQDGWA